jgi:ribonucleoside-triphosphate reductase
VYARIVGYYRPVKNWNLGKKSEFSERRQFKVSEKTVEPPAPQPETGAGSTAAKEVACPMTA